jgi:hypothetical protein
LLSSLNTALKILDTLDISNERQIMSLLQVKLFPFLSRVVGQLIMPLLPAIKSALSRRANYRAQVSLLLLLGHIVPLHPMQAALEDAGHLVQELQARYKRFSENNRFLTFESS